MFGGVMSATIFDIFGVQLAWWVYAALAMLSVAVLGYRNIDLSARLLSVVVVAEYLAVLVLDFCILRAGGDHGVNLDSFAPANVMSG
ncbi:APC family permease, partial [Acinetobacter baumannii]